MTTPNDGGPAFPSDAACSSWMCRKPSSGMSLRMYLAAKAMQGQIAFEGMEGCDPKHIAAMSFELADAMLKEREKGTTK